MVLSIHYPTKYKLDTSSNSYIVGDDTVTEPNALNSNAEGKLIIPKTYDDLAIKVIGQYAFRGCMKITEIDIQADIIQIKTRAFSDMSGLQKVILPNSLQRIEDYGLQFSNSGCVNGNVQIIFGQNSQLNYIGNEVFGFKNNIIIYYTSDQTPQCHSNVFSGVSSMLIYAPSEFYFCNKYLTFLQSEAIINACPTLYISENKRFSLIYISIFIICKI